MTSYSMEADHIAKHGYEAGEHLWNCVEAAMSAGLLPSRSVRTFECMLEQIEDEMHAGTDTELFTASAMKAIPIARLSADQRKAINAKADDAWGAFVRFMTEAA